MPRRHQPTLGWSAVVHPHTSGAIAYLSRPGLATHTTDLSEVRSWARLADNDPTCPDPEVFVVAVERFEHLLAASGHRVTWNLPGATVDEANAVIRHLNQKESA